ncbi:MAG: prepilin peptidase [bacterium]|nr:prepilin peptidase [bacterium]
MTLEALLIVLGFILGAVCGSFFNVLIYRLPVGQSIVMPPSHCMKCGEPIKWYDNIPLISFIALGGRCRACKEPYSFRYFVVELLTALLFALVVSKYVEVTTQESVLKGVGLTLFHFFFVGGMIVSAFTDLDHHIIPNEATYPGIPLGLLASFLFPSMMGLEESAHWRSLLYSCLSAVGAGGSLFIIGELVRLALKPQTIVSPIAGEFFSRSLPDSPSGVQEGQVVDVTDTVGVVRSEGEEKEVPADFFGTITKVLVKSGERVEAGQPLFYVKKEALGLGDVKILAVIGAFLGWKLAILTVLLSSLVGLLAHVLIVIARKSEWHAEIPFGLYIVPASIISYFWGNALINWYISIALR